MKKNIFSKNKKNFFQDAINDCFVTEQTINTRDRIISKNLRMSMNTRHTDRNNNILVIGGSGAGKTFRFVKPIILQQGSSFFITDPKGEIFRDTSNFLRMNGYDVKVINLLNETEMFKSSGYNPFVYISSETDVLKLITNLISNTTPANSQSSDPFWEKAEALLLQALFFYVWMEGVPVGISNCKKPGTNEDDVDEILRLIDDPNTQKVKNVRAVMTLLRFADFKTNARGQKEKSTLDQIFDHLEQKNPLHKAVVNYNKVMRGAADTVRSIIISANSRLAPVESEAILTLFDEDEINIESMGVKKTVVYCIIPDNDKTYNFVVGLLYTQAFQKLYYEADFVHGGRLPVHVTFLLDEFANVALPDDFLSLLSTMRSREISSIIIIQDISQIKKMYKEGEHESLEANCDTWVYLGGNGPSTQKELSELMGKHTYDKKTSGTTFGKQGSSSQNEDVIGRELMFPSELRRMDGKKCVVFLRGYYPILDDKIDTLHHPLWNMMVNSAKKPLFDARIERARKKGKGDEMSNFYLPNDYRYLLEEDKFKRKQYFEEKKVQEAIGGIVPPEPERNVIELSLSQFDRYYHKLISDEQTENLSEKELMANNKRLDDERKLFIGDDNENNADKDLVNGNYEDNNTVKKNEVEIHDNRPVKSPIGPGFNSNEKSIRTQNDKLNMMQTVYAAFRSVLISEGITNKKAESLMNFVIQRNTTKDKLNIFLESIDPDMDMDSILMIYNSI